MADPTNILNHSVGDAKMRQDLKASPVKKMASGEGEQRYALSTATVTRVDYEAFTVTLRTETGERFQPMPVPLTAPGAGHRHFFGALPEVGDVAIVGWASQESGHTRAPYILGWLLPGATLGHDWLPTQPYNPEDWAQTAGNNERFKGVANRIRHKMRHMEPGDVLASSSKGADLVLNESVLLTNRRANEIFLRDHDQSIVMRSLQQFHALAGARVYAGMVQRDSNLLPSQIFSDGTYWDSPRQVDGAGQPLSEFDLEDSPYLAETLTPAAVFQKNSAGLRESGIRPPGNIDPYSFLQRGLFINPAGELARDTSATAIYGGKPYFRLSSDPNQKQNAAPLSFLDTLTEYRIEVAHISDGTLPVTEQTDGFDSDRLPDAVPSETAPNGGSNAAPFIEFVMGSVVGNDAFTKDGSTTYGLPLKAEVFQGGTRSPALVSGLGSPIEEHAAILLRVSPQFSTSRQPSWWSMTKDGRVKAAINGPGGNALSAEIALSSGLRLGLGATGAGESATIESDGRISLLSDRGDNRENIGIEVSSTSGAVRIYGGGASTTNGLAQRTVTTNGGESDSPSVSLEAATNLSLKAAKSIKMSANALEFENLSQYQVQANSAIELKSGDKFSLSAKVMEVTTTGKLAETFSGPKDALPTNLPLRRTTFAGTPATGVPGGPVDQYSIIYGDRLETIIAGNHITSVQVGNQLYQTTAGTVTVASGATNLVLAGAAAALNSAGTVGMTAAGAATVNAAAVSVNAATYTNTAPAVAFNNPAHLPGGGVLTDGCINPLTGTPFRLSGSFGVQSFRIGVT